MTGAIVSIPGYQVSEEVYKSSRTIIYRGYREANSLPVVIKKKFDQFNRNTRFWK